MSRGYIALDIDGTLTDDSHGIPEKVALYLDARVKEGWEVALITGRVYTFAMRSLDVIPFEYFLAVQNGADIFSMPSRKPVSRSYIKRRDVADYHDLAKKMKMPFVVYSGFDVGDFCYYDPSLFCVESLKYLETLKGYSAADWQEISSFADLDQEEFPLIKAFGPEDDLLHIDTKYLVDHSLQTAIIVDPLKPKQSMLLSTAIDVNKGFALDRIRKLCPIDGPVIAAGDDRNDVPLLQKADFRIAVGNAPKELLDIAHYNAPPSSAHGIIQGLDYAIAKYT